MTETKAKNIRDKYCAGPHGVGDPDDLSLRKVETSVLIPKKMRDIARTEKCVKEVEEFTKCGKINNFTMVFRCRQENTVLQECLGKWFLDEDFRDKCTKEYLEERSNYRRTGIPVQSERSRRVHSPV
ncbi:hypothetical protein NQ314_016046 [Rhamnusium bicolor]|uniref:COX assembly mitochondrial protein n=1 Tax=Rhamnusium bicolor TaxID=1586634 RepID=A0AAV8WXC8_9CUCU|nr:hypothetical protein NQ314_016046 [Rhamnusium bicolor]